SRHQRIAETDEIGFQPAADELDELFDLLPLRAMVPRQQRKRQLAELAGAGADPHTAGQPQHETRIEPAGEAAGQPRPAGKHRVEIDVDPAEKDALSAEIS